MYELHRCTRSNPDAFTSCTPSAKTRAACDFEHLAEARK